MNFYNDIDPYAADWLRNMIRDGLIPPGDVSETPIEELNANELVRYTQCHFFAGIGGWPEALAIAGWPPDEPVWTGSCPCQPFSVAGKGLGEDDPRHLWPAFRRLIAQCRPNVCFGEQVAGAAGLGWFAGVHTDLEKDSYRVGFAELCAAGQGAPHIRQRLFWVADTKHEQCQGFVPERRVEYGANGSRQAGELAGCGAAGGMGESDRARPFPGAIASNRSGAS